MKLVDSLTNMSKKKAIGKCITRFAFFLFVRHAIQYEGDRFATGTGALLRLGRIIMTQCRHFPTFKQEPNQVSSKIDEQCGKPGHIER